MAKNNKTHFFYVLYSDKIRARVVSYLYYKYLHREREREREREQYRFAELDYLVEDIYCYSEFHAQYISSIYINIYLSNRKRFPCLHSLI